MTVKDFISALEYEQNMCLISVETMDKSIKTDIYLTKGSTVQDDIREGTCGYIAGLEPMLHRFVKSFTHVEQQVGDSYKIVVGDWR